MNRTSHKRLWLAGLIGIAATTATNVNAKIHASHIRPNTNNSEVDRSTSVKQANYVQSSSSASNQSSSASSSSSSVSYVDFRGKKYTVNRFSELTPISNSNATSNASSASNSNSSVRYIKIPKQMQYLNHNSANSASSNSNNDNSKLNHITNYGQQFNSASHASHRVLKLGRQMSNNNAQNVSKSKATNQNSDRVNNWLHLHKQVQDNKNRVNFASKSEKIKYLENVLNNTPSYHRTHEVKAASGSINQPKPATVRHHNHHVDNNDYSDNHNRILQILARSSKQRHIHHEERKQSRIMRLLSVKRHAYRKAVLPKNRMNVMNSKRYLRHRRRIQRENDELNKTINKSIHRHRRHVAKSPVWNRISKSEKRYRRRVIYLESRGNWGAIGHGNVPCYGRFQLEMPYFNGKDWHDHKVQEIAAYNYVYGRYGSWRNAYKFHVTHGWY